MLIRWLSVVFLSFTLPGCLSQAPHDPAGSLEPETESVTETPVPNGPVDTELLVAGCFGCHGPAGHSAVPAIPSLAGLPEDYFIGVMRAYQYGGRYGSVMGRIALGYSQDEITRMARYFSRLEHAPHTQRIDWNLRNKGRQLHRLYCRECHGDLTLDAEAGVNKLNGQWMDYLRWTLQDYLIGINQGDAQMSQQLTLLIRRHGVEGLEVLINYLGSAKP